MANIRASQLELRYDPVKGPDAGHALNGLLEDKGLTDDLGWNGQFSFQTEEKFLEITWTDNRDSADKSFNSHTGQWNNGMTYAEAKAAFPNIPTYAEVIADLADYTTEYASYANKRKRRYPHHRDQLDQLWHDIDEGKLDKTGSWYTAIKAVKDANG